MAQKKERVPVREQEPQIRVQNFQEVCYGYNVTEAQEEATRCLQCKKPRCMEACPVNIHIPQFIKKVLEGEPPRSMWACLPAGNTMRRILYCGH